MGRWKYTVAEDENRRALFDLRLDPGERHNVVAEQPAVARRLAGLVEAWRAGLAAETAAGPAASVSPEVSTKLRALGYAE